MQRSSVVRVAAAAVVAAGSLAAAAGTVTAGTRNVGVTLVGSGFRAPVAVVGGPRRDSPLLYVVERGGLIRILLRGRIVATPFLDIRRIVAGNGLRGLLSLAFHPRYLSNGRFFVLYVGRNGHVYVAEYRARSGTSSAASRRVLLEHVPYGRMPFSHYGGQLAFDADGLLYASLGDGNRPELAQDPTSLAGKIVRLDVDRRSPSVEIVASGLRNPWRFSFHGRSMLIGDPGDTAREEINYLPRDLFGAANFGWDAFEGTLRRRTQVDLRGTLIRPALEYRHASRRRCYSVVGGYVYHGPSAPSLRGRYVFGDLCGGVWSALLRSGRLVDRRPEPIVVGPTLSSFGVDGRGELYAVGYANGQIFRVTD